MSNSTFADSIAGKPRSAAHNKSFLALTLAFCLVTCSLFSHVTLWIMAIGFIAVVMRFLLYLGLYQHVPGTRIVNMLGIVSGGMLILMSQDMPLLSSMINLLIMASALKIMVLHTQKDLLFIFISVLFLSALGFIIHTEFIYTCFYLGIILILLTTLATHFAPKTGLRLAGQQTLILCLQALPVAIILYLLVPHFPPFWHVPAPKQHSTGLTDTVKPGNIADLAQSPELAMIVRFPEGNIPKYHQRYWRAVVIDEFDGETWQPSALQQAYQTLQQPQSSAQDFVQHSNESIAFVDYEVVLMANQTRYVPTLHSVMGIRSASNYEHEYVTTLSNHVISNQDQVFTTNFSASSMLNVNEARPLNEVQRTQYLQTPDDGSVPRNNLHTNPRTQAWVAQITQTANSLPLFIDVFNRYLIDQSFTYTLQPPLMHQNMVDTFLFDAQTGFCSHYASAMGYALRLAGYPTRLVAGYQGGEQINDDTLMIYQYDAHAWLEAYSPVTGWIRLDPTAVIAPQRISDGLAEALTQRDEYLADETFSMAKYAHLPGFDLLHDWMQEGSALWHGNVIGFDNDDKQHALKQIMDKFNIQHPVFLGLIGLSLIGMCLGVYFLYGQKRTIVMAEHIKWYQKARLWCVSQYSKADTTSAHDIAHYPPTRFISWLEIHAPRPVYNMMKIMTDDFIAMEYAPQGGSGQPAVNFKQHFKNVKRAHKL